MEEVWVQWVMESLENKGKGVDHLSFCAEKSKWVNSARHSCPSQMHCLPEASNILQILAQTNGSVMIRKQFIKILRNTVCLKDIRPKISPWHFKALPREIKERKEEESDVI